MADNRALDGLSPKQEQCVIALLNQPTVRHAAQAAGVGARTLYRWMDEPAFAAAYRKARREAFTHAISLTQRYAPLAINTLATIMADKAAGPNARVAAATALLKFSRESIELDDLAARIETLEKAAQAPGPRLEAA